MSKLFKIGVMKVAVVTGAAKGLGKVFADFLANQGYVVVVHYNKSKKEAQETLGEIQRKSSGSIKISADLKDEIQVRVMFSKILKKFGRIDLLINNVGNFLYREFSKTTNAQFRDVIESNLYSTLFCSREALKYMRIEKNGQIINTGCVGAERITITRNSTPYFMAKTNIYILTKIMAHDEAKYGIKVNMISPASLAEDIFDSRQFPMRRKASYADVLKVLKFLISKDAYYINGANIEVAGGFVPGLSKGK